MLYTLFSWAQSGVKDWLWQRISAVVILLYSALVLGFWALNPQATFTAWHRFLMSMSMRVLGTLAFVSFAIHAWLGIWTVLTDYVKPRCVQQCAKLLTIILIVAYVFIAMMIFWRL